MSGKIDRQISGYLDDIKQILACKKAYLFGSYLTEKYGKDSDIDIAIFSPEVTDTNRHEYTKKCLRAISKYKLDIQPLVFSFDDYLDLTNDFIQHEILEKGKEVIGNLNL